VTVLASAAACTAGPATVPVYEIYKAGAEPHWRPGLCLLEPLGLRAVLIPHYDNAEGGTHDTRYCYLGERRLARMERELPPGTAVLGIDEHTAVLIDLDGEEVSVAGRGGLTVRLPGFQEVLPAGTRTDLAALRNLATGRPRPAASREAGASRAAAAVSEAGVSPEAAVARRAAAPGEAAAARGAHAARGTAGQALPVEVVPPTLEETTRACERRFEEAMAELDPVASARAVLDLEAELAAWSADTEQDAGGVEQTMDRGGVHVEDTPDGPRWTVRPR
jgi:hypothetical protein